VTFPLVKLDQQVKQWYHPASVVETLEGLKNADEIVKVSGVHAIFAVSSDFGIFAGLSRAIPTTSVRSTSCTTQRSKPA
jgi:2-keto-3-deoxy-L-rhamnonate aldolase RhmA